MKLEFGARSDVEPHEEGQVRSYLSEALEESESAAPVLVRVVAARRTFWEKAMLLHEQNFKAAQTPRPRLSRHLYDLYCMLGRADIAEAVEDYELCQSVASHRRIFFKQSGNDVARLRWLAIDNADLMKGHDANVGQVQNGWASRRGMRDVAVPSDRPGPPRTTPER